MEVIPSCRLVLRGQKAWGMIHEARKPDLVRQFTRFVTIAGTKKKWARVDGQIREETANFAASAVSIQREGNTLNIGLWMYFVRTNIRGRLTRPSSATLLHSPELKKQTGA